MGKHYYRGTTNVLRHAWQAAHGDSSKRVGLIIFPGMFRGVAAGGYVQALEEWLLSEGFVVVLATSTGFFAALYMMARQSFIGSTIYYAECCTKRFFSWWRFFRKEEVMNLDYLGSVMRQKPKKLDEQAVHKHPATLLIVLTDADTGEGLVLDAKEVSKRTGIDLVGIGCASARAPVVTHGATEVDGRMVMDGMCIPLRQMAKELNLTDLLVLMNKPSAFTFAWWEKVLGTALTTFLLRAFPPKIRERMMTADACMDTDLDELLADETINVMAIETDGTIGVLTRDSYHLRRETEDAKRHMHRWIAQAIRGVE